MPAPIDLTGQRFGRLVAIEKKKEGRRTKWLCRCDCGQEKWIVMDLLRDGRAKSCGCLRKEVAKATRTVVETPGTRYGKLVVIGPSDLRTQQYQKWLCQCDCGNQTHVDGKALRNGNTSSCGCGIAEAITKAHAIDITGQRFGRLVALEPVVGARHANGKAKRQWKFRCDCGKDTISTVSQVRFGMTRSCGCLVSDTAVLNFHNEGHRAYADDPEYAQRESLLYLVEVQKQFDKIGIAFDLDARSQGEYTETWWTRTMPRAYCWAVEQVALHYTREHAVIELPDGFETRGGTSEFRQGMVIDDVVDLLEGLCDEAMEMDWREFYDKHLL